MRTLLTLAALITLSLANSARAQVDAFYSGIYLGMPITDAFAYCFSGQPPIAASYMTWGSGHTPPGQRLIDFRTKEQERRLEVTYRLSDGIIVSIGYYNIGGGHFSNDDLKSLLEVQRRHGRHVVGHLHGEYGNEDFEVTTAEQEKLENTKR